MSAQRAPLPGDRWHFSHGPIDLVIGAHGEPAAVAAAHEAAWRRFGGVLAELVGELPLLRAPVGGSCTLSGPVACRMWRACAALRESFVTPMAAVAGAVAEEIVGHYRRAGVDRAWVNNGGDIAVHLTPGQSVRIGIFSDLAKMPAALASAGLPLDGEFVLDAASPVRGVATSGWRGRSLSMGIADSVTVLATSAAQADAAATVVANAVDAADPRIVRAPASSVRDDTDLGERLVTIDVPALERGTLRRALAAGLERAFALQAAGVIHEAVLVCQGEVAATGPARGDLIAARETRAPCEHAA